MEAASSPLSDGAAKCCFTPGGATRDLAFGDLLKRERSFQTILLRSSRTVLRFFVHVWSRRQVACGCVNGSHLAAGNPAAQLLALPFLSVPRSWRAAVSSPRAVEAPFADSVSSRAGRRWESPFTFLLRE